MKTGSLTCIVRILGTFGLALLISAPPVLADAFTFTAAPNTKRFNFKGGESQSAVVAPGKKGQCPNGRIFISDEHKHPPLASISSLSETTNVVHWRNLPGPKKMIPGEGVSLFFSPGDTTANKDTVSKGQPQQAPRSGQLKSWGFDHQLVSLPNGDLIYQRAVLSRAPITPRPDWWDFSFRDGFGPGARSTLATWRSTDCGATFEYISEIDTHGPKYEECANPRNLGLNEKGEPIISMGGTDGPNLVVDKDDGTAYAVFPCVGNEFKKDGQGKPVFGPGIAKTYVFSLKSGKKTFINRGAYQPDLWGPTAVPLSGNRLAVGLSGIGPSSQSGLMIGKAQSNTGLFSFLNKAVAVNGVSWGWEQQNSFPWEIPLKTDLRKHVSAGIAGNTVLARVPGQAEMLLLAFPTMVEKLEGESKKKTHGFRVYYYHAKNVDPQNNQLVETESIIPSGPAEKSMIMHLTAIDPGDGGPILLFWYDLNGDNKTARIRGRFIYTESDGMTSNPFANIGESKDFDVALVNGQSTEFSLESGGSYWFGDYKTAGGFKSSKVEAAPLFTVHTYRYFPIWIQPDSTVNYTEITVTRTIGKRLFEEEMKSKEPFRKMFTECCDFVSLIEKAKAQKGDISPEKQQVAEAAALASRLLTADPNLKDPKLWIGRKPIVKLQPRQTTLTTLEQSRVMRNIFKDHQEKSRRHIKQN